MASATIVVTPGDVRIPTPIPDLEAFRAWARSDEFPPDVRIDYLAGEVEIDMSPEDVTTHGTVKMAVAAALHALVVDRLDIGLVLTDSSRFTSPAADLSVEPDVLVMLYESLRGGRARLVPRPGGPADRYLEIEGAADLVVECVSDSSEGKDTRSEGKDTRRLLALYHRAGVAEYWLVDARGPEAVLVIHRRAGAGYERLVADPTGFVPSPLLGRAFRLVRREPLPGVPVYRLAERPEVG